MQSYIICDYIWLLEMERKNQRSHQKNLKGPSQLNLHPWAKVFRVVEIHRGWVSSWSSLMKPVASQTSAMCGDGERTSGQQKMWGWHMISKQNHGSVHKKNEHRKDKHMVLGLFDIKRRTESVGLWSQGLMTGSARFFVF